MESDTTPDEAERAFMTARYDVSNEQLAERTAAAPDIGGSLLVGLNAFMEQKMTAKGTKTWREMGDIHLQDAQQPELSERGRTDAAFDACYTYVLCIVGEKSELYTHPDRSIFVLAATALGWDDRVLRPARKHVYARDNSLRDANQFDVLLAHLVRKKKEALLGIEFAERASFARLGRRRHPPEEIALREDYCKRMSALK